METKRTPHVTDQAERDITPEAATLAEEQEVDLDEVTGTGKEGRILVSDVQAVIDKRAEAADTSGVVTSGDVRPAKPEREKLTNLGDMPDPPDEHDEDDDETAAIEYEASQRQAELDREEGQRYSVRLMPGALPYPGIGVSYVDEETGVTKSCRVQTRTNEYLTRPQVRAVAKALQERYGVEDPGTVLIMSPVREVVRQKKKIVTSASVKVRRGHSR